MNNKLSHIDALSLQLMCSKGKYNKYLSKENPKEYLEKKTHSDKVKKYSNKILKIINKYLSDENCQITNDLDDAFEYFSKECIKHIEIEKINKETNGGCYEEDYKEEVLFEEPREDSDDSDNSDENEEESSQSWATNSRKKSQSGYDWSINPSLSEYINYSKNKK